jgi:hypothetical protein
MKISTLLRCWRGLEGVGVRAAAKQVGISFSTLSCIENGEEPKRLAAVLAKCVCVCANCHAKTHAGLSRRDSP